MTRISAILFVISIPISTGITHLFLLSLIFFWFLEGDLKNKAFWVFKNPTTLLTLAFFMLFLIGSSYSKAPTDDIIELLDKMSKFLYIPFLLSLFVAKKLRRMATHAFIWTMVFVFCLVSVKYFGKISFPFGNKFTEACLFKNHIDTNLLMAYATFLIAHYALQSRLFGIRLLLYLLISVLTFYTWFMSDGRSGQVVFSVLSMLFFIQHFRWKGILWGGLFVFLLITSSSFFSKRFQERWKDNSLQITRVEIVKPENNLKAIEPVPIENIPTVVESVKPANKLKRIFPSFSDIKLLNKEWRLELKNDLSTKERLHFAKNTLKLIKQKPWIGYGTGSFKGIYKEQARENQWLTTSNPHNEYINVFFQLGILGLAAILFLFGKLFIMSFRLPILEQRFAQGILVAIGIGSLGNSWLMDFTPGYLFVLFVGICFAAYTDKGQQEIKQSRN